jgi:hypothetical protein
VNCIPTIPPGSPVLDEETFQRLLAAAHLLQECNDRHVQEPKIYAGLSGCTIAQNAQPVQVVLLTPQAAEVPGPPQEKMIIQAGGEPFAPQSHGIIPPEIVHQFSILASQLEALTQQQIRSDAPWTQLPVSVAEEIPVEEQQGAAD